MNLEANSWLLLLHRLPPENAYLRVKVWRRLQRVGAISVQNAVYALPNFERCREHFEWIVREIEQAGGTASVGETRFVVGAVDDGLWRAFTEARASDYQALVEEARKCLGPPTARPERARLPANFVATVARLRRRQEELRAIDYFPAPESGADELERLLARLETLADPEPAQPARTSTRRYRIADVQGRTWVTRKGVHVDRIACAWLIREHIDPEARFKFVPSKGYAPEPGELRFDMYEAELTHDGDLCTFEVLLREFELSSPGLRAVAEIVHAIDLKVEEPTRPETVGIAHAIEGITRRHTSDEDRLRDGAALFAALAAYFERRER